jgi:hypothetical protein
LFEIQRSKNLSLQIILTVDVVKVTPRQLLSSPPTPTTQHRTWIPTEQEAQFVPKPISCHVLTFAVRNISVHTAKYGQSIFCSRQAEILKPKFIKMRVRLSTKLQQEEMHEVL